MLASTVVMIRPAGFGFDPETAETNAFQQTAEGDVSSLALAEFDTAVSVLRKYVNVIVVQERPGDPLPDAIFPNNWFSTHEDGRLCLYPMLTPLRRKEVRIGLLVLPLVSNDLKLVPFDFRPMALDKTDPAYLLKHGEWKQGGALEGTGSLVLDRANRLAFACESPRTSPSLASRWCEEFGYELVLFQMLDDNGLPIYHTNVILSVSPHFVVADERVLKISHVADRLREKGRTVMSISPDQTSRFGANVLGLLDLDDQPILVMSTAAWDCNDSRQKEILKSSFAKLVVVNIPTIERVGGGGVRCMLAEIFLPHASPSLPLPPWNPGSERSN